MCRFLGLCPKEKNRKRLQAKRRAGPRTVSASAPRAAGGMRFRRRAGPGEPGRPHGLPANRGGADAENHVGINLGVYLCMWGTGGRIKLNTIICNTQCLFSR